MADKTEIVGKISAILGVKLESMERMTKEDLEKLLKMLEEPTALLKTGFKSLRGQARTEVRERVRELLDELLSEREGGGLFGFGIIPIELPRTRSQGEQAQP